MGEYPPPEVYEEHYLRGSNPRAQSGFGGDEERWEIGRRPIVEGIDRGGTFLDVGCASGYLMECVGRWSEHAIEPYGLDFAPGLVELARRRLPRWADRIFLGDALRWEPPRRFDFVRTSSMRPRADAAGWSSGSSIESSRREDASSSAGTATLARVCGRILCGASSARSAASRFSTSPGRREDGGSIVELAVLERPF